MSRGGLQLALPSCQQAGPPTAPLTVLWRLGAGEHGISKEVRQAGVVVPQQVMHAVQEEDLMRVVVRVARIAAAPGGGQRGGPRPQACMHLVLHCRLRGSHRSDLHDTAAAS